MAKEKEVASVTTYNRESWGYSIRRDGVQYGAAPGDCAVVAQFLGIDPTRDIVEFEETFVAPKPRNNDSFPPHIRSAKYGFGKAK